MLLEVVTTVSPILALPAWVDRAALLFLAAGLPVAIILAWAFELTPDGLRRDSGGAAGAAYRRRPIDYVIVIVLGAALAFFVADRVRAPAGSSGPGSRPSVAVLPFANLSGDEQAAPFAAGIHDDLLTHLSRIASLRTVPRTSVLKYRGTTLTIPEIAAELRVDAVLVAGVQRAGDRVRINAQLIDATSDEHMWAEQFDRGLTTADVFDIQSDIATSIAAALRATLTNEERLRLRKVPTDSLAALDAYFLGKQMLENRALESLWAAIEYFETVVELDPNFALGWSGLADAYMLLPEYSFDVDRDMVDLGDDRIAAFRYARNVVEPLDDVDLPERLREVQRAGVDARDQDAQLTPVAGMGQGDVADVVLEVEVLVVHPVREIEFQRHAHEAATE